MKGKIGWLKAAGLLLALQQAMGGQQASTEQGSSPERQREPYFTETRPLTSLSFSGRELVDQFNRRLSRFRLLLVLSSSHEEDLRAAAAVERFLEHNPEANWSVLAVWTAAEPTDSLNSSLLATSVLSDRRVEHFYSASGSMAQAFALRLGYPRDRPPQGLFMGFSAGLSWDGLAPRPSFWLHNHAGFEREKLFSEAQWERLASSAK